MVRLGDTKKLEEVIAEARAAGAFIERTTESVCAKLSPDETLFWALKKGDSDVWIFNYNDKYYGDVASGSESEDTERTP